MKKLLALLLSLMLMAMPFASYADAVNTTMTFTHGSLSELLSLFLGGNAEAYGTALNDLLDCVSLTEYVQNGQAGITLSLSGSEAVTANVAVTEAGLSLSSNLLGDDVVSVTFEELITLCNQQLAQYGLSLETLMTVISTYLQDLDFSDLTFEQTNALVTEIMGRAVYAEVTEQPNDCDPAAALMTIHLTGADIANVYTATLNDVLNCKFISKVVTDLLPLAGSDMTIDELKAGVEQTLTETFSLLGDIPVYFYLDENGSPVKEEFTLSMQGMTEYCAFTKLTTADAVELAAVVTMGTEEQELMSAAVVYDMYSETSGAISYSVDMSGTPILFSGAWSLDDAESTVYFSAAYGETLDGVSLTAHMVPTETGKSADVTYAVTGDTLTALVSDPVLVTVHYDISTVADYPAIAGNEVHPMSMTEDELNEWTSSVSMNALIGVMGALQQLPASVLSLMYSTAE